MLELPEQELQGADWRWPIQAKQYVRVPNQALGLAIRSRAARTGQRRSGVLSAIGRSWGRAQPCHGFAANELGFRTFGLAR